MFTIEEVDATSKPAFYEQVSRQLFHLIEGERNELANLANASALLNEVLNDINWVGFYLWYEDEHQLILGPFQGKPACIRIAEGKGVCGTAAAAQEAQVVADVFAFPGHIACDPASRSEVVVPIVQDGRLIGVLDIDSPNPGRFDEADAKGLTQFAAILAGGTDFAQR